MQWNHFSELCQSTEFVFRLKRISKSIIQAKSAVLRRETCFVMLQYVWRLILRCFWFLISETWEWEHIRYSIHWWRAVIVSISFDSMRMHTCKYNLIQTRNGNYSYRLNTKVSLNSNKCLWYERWYLRQWNVHNDSAACILICFHSFVWMKFVWAVNLWPHL